MKHIKFIALSSLLLFFFSCYEDLGNYTYNDNINQVKIQLDSIYGIPRKDTVLVIKPLITQTQRADNKNLRYVWRVNSKNNLVLGDTLSTADTLAIKIDLSDPNVKFKYWVRLYVTDTTNNAVQMYPTTIDVLKSYQGAWIALHEKNGSAALGSIEYMGKEPTVKLDAYYQENKTRLTGKPIRLGVMSVDASSSSFRAWGYDAASVFFCFTSNPDESGLYRQDVGFKLDRTMQELIFNPDYNEGWNPEKVLYYGGDLFGSTAVSNGKVFQGSSYGPLMYGMPIVKRIEPDYTITHATSAGHNHLFFDNIHKRFLVGNTSQAFYYEKHDFEYDYISNMWPISKNDTIAYPFNPDNIGNDKEMIYMGPGYWYGVGKYNSEAFISFYALAQSTSQDSVYVYEFHGGAVSGVTKDDPAAATGYFKLKKPSGMDKNTPCATSREYNRYLFYGVGNKIYKLDFGSIVASSTLIYEHPNPEMKASVMTFARPTFITEHSAADYANYGYPPFRSLGIAFHSSKGDEVVVLNLNARGVIDKPGKYPSTQTYKGFGAIKDLKFL